MTAERIEREFDIYAKVADGTFNLGMAAQNLNSTQIAGGLIDGCLGAPK